MRSALPLCLILACLPASFAGEALPVIEVEFTAATEQRRIEFALPSMPNGDRPPPESPIRGRSSGNVAFRVIRPDSAPPAFVSHVQVVKLIDDSGRFLVPAGLTNPRGPVPLRQAPQPGELAASVQFTGGERQTRSFREITGEIELLVPTAGSDAVRRFEKLASIEGAPIRDPVLQTYGIVFAFLRGENYERHAATLAPFRVRPERAFDSFIVIIQDPGRRLFAYQFQDRSGKRIELLQSFLDGNVVFGFRRIELPPDATLTLYVAAPSALHSYSFRLTDVPLP